MPNTATRRRAYNCCVGELHSRGKTGDGRNEVFRCCGDQKVKQDDQPQDLMRKNENENRSVSSNQYRECAWAANRGTEIKRDIIDFPRVWSAGSCSCVQVNAIFASVRDSGRKISNTLKNINTLKGRA
jgi:hypothetical protein